MKDIQHSQASEHQQVSLLLPWYVNKTLHSDENHLVETHLKSCLVCKIELTNLQKLSTAICTDDLLVPVAHASFSELKKRIHQSTVTAKQKKGIFKALSAFRQWNVKINVNNLATLYPSFVLASLLLVTYLLISPAFFAAKQDSSNTLFHTLSNSQLSTHKKNEIRLVFSYAITQEKIIQILASVHGQIVAGPTPQGVFTVRIGGEEISSKNLLKTVSLLRDNSLVIFAEPAFAMSSPTNQAPG